jgi:hypothetical protein
MPQLRERSAEHEKRLLRTEATPDTLARPMRTLLEGIAADALLVLLAVFSAGCLPGDPGTALLVTNACATDLWVRVDDRELRRRTTCLMSDRSGSGLTSGAGSLLASAAIRS